jgi:hypothetical protein
MSLTLRRVKQVLDYDQDTGVFTWKVATATSTKVGTVAGTVYDGYRRITIDGVRMFAHRLAWWYSVGKKPTRLIDHINGLRDDNRIANLRQVTPSENNQNQVHRGYYFDRERKQYRAKISVGGKTYSLGCHACEIDARNAYQNAKSKLHVVARAV